MSSSNLQLKEKHKRAFLLTTLIFSLCFNAQAVLEWETVEIPMTDGFSLEADIYLPDDWTSGPAILIQTPYNKDLYHLAGIPIGIGFAQEDLEYAMVIADWRGFWGSADAAYAGSPTRGEDGYDCVQWVSAQDWCNGDVGTWGLSALGRVQFMTARENPPNLRCMVPLVAAPQFDYAEYYPGGVYRTEFVEQLDALGFGLSTAILSSPYHNLLWTVSETANFYPEEIHVPTFMIGGWYDHNIETMMAFFPALQESSPPDVQDQHRLLFGPWVHGGVGSEDIGELEYPAASGWSDSLSWVFFDYHLKGIDNGWNETSAVQYFQMGSDEWHSASTWPIATIPYRLYFRDSEDKMSADELIEGEFVADKALQYDPEDPSPTVGGPTLRNDLEQGPYDQAPVVESRNDVLSFTTSVLPDDVKLAGPSKVHLLLKSDVADTDFAVRLCDVYPDGRSMLVNDGIFRMRFINGFSETDETFMMPETLYECDIELPNSALTFLAGHRIRVDISGSNYPRFNRNMNTGGEMYPDGNGDVLVAPLIAQSEVRVSDVQNTFSYLELNLSELPDQVNEIASTSFDIYPNPTSGRFTLNVPLKTHATMLQVIDMNGVVVIEKKLANNISVIEMDGLARGIYQVMLVTDSGILSKKIAVN